MMENLPMLAQVAAQKLGDMRQGYNLEPPLFGSTGCEHNNTHQVALRRLCAAGAKKLLGCSLCVFGVAASKAS
jgi:hypothetical protein